jgi:hypothetical protein
VGHDTVNRISLLLALDVPLARFWRVGQQPCAVNVLEYDDATGGLCQTTPAFGIGQRAILARTPVGNVMWERLALIDDSIC